VEKNSLDALRQQTEIITEALIKGAGATFEAEMKIGVSAFLMPLAHIIRDAEETAQNARGTEFPYLPLKAWFYPKPPVTGPKDNDDSAVSYPGVMRRRFHNYGISKAASVNFLSNQFNGLPPDSTGATANLLSSKAANKKLLDTTGFMDYFAPKMWETNPEYIGVFIGAENSATNQSLFRHYPGYATAEVSCGVMLGRSEYFLTTLVPALDSNLQVNSSTPIKDQNLYMKKILKINGVDVSTLTDFKNILKTFPNQNVTIQWWPYDPSVRSWYINAVQHAKTVSDKVDWLTALTDGIYFGSPYTSAWDSEWLLSASKAIFKQSSCEGGLAECSTNTPVIGVVSFDLYLPFMSHITNRVRFRETGEAHLFHVESGAVVSSAQWSPTPTESGILMKDVGITKQSFGAERVRRISENDFGSFSFDGSLIAWVKVLNGRYAVVIETPEKEITESLTKEMKYINEATLRTFGSVMGLTAFVLVMLSASITLLGIVVVPMLNQTEKEAQRVVMNLGKDLFDGIGEKVNHGYTGFAAKLGGLAEVSLLRQGFQNMLHKLAEKRKMAAKGNWVANPMWQDDDLRERLSKWSPPWEEYGASIPVEVTKHKLSISDEEKAPEEEIKWYSSAVMRIFALIGLPLVAGMSIALAVACSSVSTDANVWLEPIRETLIREERSTLPIRLESAADALALVFRRNMNSLVSYKDLVQRTWNSGFNLISENDTSRINFSPTFPRVIYPNYLPVEISVGQLRITSLPQGWPYPDVVRGGWFSSSRVPAVHNYWVAGYYGNMFNWTTSGWDSPLLVSNKWNETKQEQEVMSLADAFTRELYLSNDINVMYVGFEATESFRSYPYDDSSGLTTWRGKCLRDVPMSWWNLPHLANEGWRLGYTPLCRPWYERAKIANGTAVWNGIDQSASNNMLYLAISVALKDATGKLFGVAGIDFSLKELSNILDEKILKSGYFFLADKEMGLVVHPHVEVKMSSILSVEFLCEGNEKSEEKQWFQQTWDSAMLTTKSGILGYKKCGKESLLAWNWIEETEYILFLTVPMEDISATADAAASTVMKAIEIVIGLCIGLAYPAVFGFLFIVAYSMSNLLKQLVKVTNEIAIAPEADITIPKTRFFDVAELVSIVKNINRLLAALRFGNAKWNKGDLNLDIANCRYLEVALRDVYNLSGRGVILNNKGNALRQLARKNREEQVSLLEQASSCFMEAFEISKKVGGEEIRQANRLFGAGLIQMDKIVLLKNLEGFDDTMNMLHSAQKLYVDQQNWQGLSRMSFLITTHAGSSEFQNHFLGTVEAMLLDCIGILKSYLQFSKALKDKDFNSICHLCYVAWWVGRKKDLCLLLWPLSFVPKMSKQLLDTLVTEVLGQQYCFSEAAGQENMSPSAPPQRNSNDPSNHYKDRVYKSIQMHMSNAYGDDWKVQQRSVLKDVLFVLDASGSMAGSRLQVCKNSIKNILNNFIDDDDRVGFMAFASHTKLLFDLILRKGNLERMTKEVDDLSTFGATSFYDAILEAVNKLVAECTDERDASKWIMALTDGEDTCSTIDLDGVKAIELLRKSGINIAVITVGNLPAETMRVVNAYVKAANRGMHVEANDTGKIATAFERVADLIQGVSEQL